MTLEQEDQMYATQDRIRKQNIEKIRSAPATSHRQDLWIKAYLASIGQSVPKEWPGEWADYAVLEFDRRFSQNETTP